uniref:Uncharacterized protein n=1 Tax=Anguilla anguilla TaxID=7936 RepID=A0A0E9R307_ANGAN
MVFIAISVLSVLLQEQIALFIYIGVRGASFPPLVIGADRMILQLVWNLPRSVPVSCV